MLAKVQLTLTAFAILALSAGATAAPSGNWSPIPPPLPAPTGQVIRVSNVEQLYRAAEVVEPGGTIMLADGHYMMPRYFAIKTDNVTIRGESNDRRRVILDGANSRHGELLAVTGATGVTIANLKIQNVKFNGIKINSDLGAEKVTIYNCFLHNIWQRAIKGPALPEEKQAQGVRDCRIQYCLFYNDRPKQYADDSTDTASTFRGNYVGGIDVMNARGWTISDNIFVGIQGRTREGRAAVFLWHNSTECVVERNVILDCDVGISLGNPHRGGADMHAVDVMVRNNFVSGCPETGILAAYTRDCLIYNNTVHEPNSRRRRLIWSQDTNENLRIENNLLINAPPLIARASQVETQNNQVVGDLATEHAENVGQQFLSAKMLNQLIALPAKLGGEQNGAAEADDRDAAPAVDFDPQRLAVQPPKVLEMVRRIHARFDGTPGYVAQFGDSITHSLAFWAPIGNKPPQRYLTDSDDLPKLPPRTTWSGLIRGTRDKGPTFANQSGWRADQLAAAVGAVLEKQQPEAAIIMIGTNDISDGKVPADFQKHLVSIVRQCAEAGCVPILNTIPPRRDREEAVAQINQIIRHVANGLNLPLVDYHAAIVTLRPGDTWDGTLISHDGVHPSGGEVGDYSPENLRNSGYALRNWMNFLVFRQLYFQVLAED